VDDVPFFDIELPRELAMKIFQYLDPRDLCRCCQVCLLLATLCTVFVELHVLVG
jgi:hypothetical protein